MIDNEIAFFSDWAKMRDCLPDIDEMEVGSLSLRLRRMLVDGKPLVNIGNRKHRKNIHFPLAPSVEHRLSKTVVLYIFPKDMLSNSTNLFVKMDDFLSHKIL
jgi:hypothetical protein